MADSRSGQVRTLGQINSNPIVKIQFAVVEQSSGRIRVAIDDRNFVYTLALKLNSGKETGRT